jgi:hypothetical protein
MWWLIPAVLSAIAGAFFWLGSRPGRDPVTGAMEELFAMGMLVAAAASTLTGLVTS